MAADRIGGLIDEGRIKGKNRSKLEDYLRKQQESGQITPWEKQVAEKLGIDTESVGHYVNQITKKTTGGQKKGTDILLNNLVQRGVTLEQAEMIARGKGIEKPKPPHKTTPTQHVGGTPHSRDPWTSTSRSSETAEYYATHDKNGNLLSEPTAIIEIDLNKIDPQNIIDVSTPEKAQQLTRPFCQNAAAYDQEVLIKGDIPIESISKIIKLQY